MRLTAAEARELQSTKREEFANTLGTIRQMADSNIKDASRRGEGSIVFEVPLTVFGKGSYSRKAMGRALAEQYYEDGYDVTGTCLKLVIKWEGEERDTGSIKLSKKTSPPAPVGMPLPFTKEFDRQVSTGARSAQSKKTSVSVSLR